MLARMTGHLSQSFSPEALKLRSVVRKVKRETRGLARMSVPKLGRMARKVKEETRGFVPDVPTMPAGDCWLVRRGPVAPSPVSKQAEGAIGMLCETLRALGVTLEFENGLRGLNSQRVRTNPADIPRQPERA